MRLLQKEKRLRLKFLFSFLVLVLAAFGQDLPNAPSASQPPKFFQFGRWDDIHPLRTNRQSFLSKTFLLSHGIELAATVYDIEMTHQGLAHHKCVEGNRVFGTHPSRGEMYIDNGVAFGAMTGLDFLMDKYIWRPLSLISPTYASIVHIQGGNSWRGRCW